MEWIIQAIALLLMFILAALKTLHCSPAPMSEFELQRRLHAGDGHAQHEAHRRALLPTFIALRTLLEIIITVTLVAMLVANTSLWVAVLLSFGYLLLANVVAAKCWLERLVWPLQQKHEPRTYDTLHKLAPLVKPFAPRYITMTDLTVASPEELHNLIEADTTMLTLDQKAALLAAFTFGDQKVADAMVGRDAIATVEAGETIGPVLLDRLHKNAHNMFPVIKKDLDHIVGLLYMHDIVPPPPDVTKVKDALRPSVHYVRQSSPLVDVLRASLQTGRQLFIVVDDDDKTVGLITLTDALATLLGSKPNLDEPATTQLHQR